MMALQFYANAFKDRFPTDNDVALLPQYMDGPGIQALLPHNVDAPDDIDSWSPDRRASWLRKHSAWVLLQGGRKQSSIASTNTAVALYRKFDDSERSVVVGFTDGHVRLMRVRDARRMIEEREGRTIEEIEAAQRQKWEELDAFE